MQVIIGSLALGIIFELEADVSPLAGPFDHARRRDVGAEAFKRFTRHRDLICRKPPTVHSSCDRVSKHRSTRRFFPKLWLVEDLAPNTRVGLNFDNALDLTPISVEHFCTQWVIFGHSR